MNDFLNPDHKLLFYRSEQSENLTQQPNSQQSTFKNNNKKDVNELYLQYPVFHHLNQGANGK